jgi:hypothetical protein
VGVKARHASTISHASTIREDGVRSPGRSVALPDRMVVPLILLGTVTKLAFAVALTHRTRLWWLPGTLAIGLGALASLHPSVPTTVAEGSAMLGGCAVVIAYLAGATARSSRTALAARSSRPEPR